MPVFLNSCHVNHMPNGRQNEWKDFFSLNSYELEANAFIPVFWLLLYSQENIKFARYVDDYDINNHETIIDRQECFEDFGNETYFYFIISKEIALKNLRERKKHFLQMFGSKYKKYYNIFEQIITEEYHQYILLRTNGLALDEQSEQNFKKSLIHYENLNKIHDFTENPYWQDIKYQMSFYENVVYFLMGMNFDCSRTIPVFKIKNTKYISKSDAKTIPSYLYWIFAIINGLVTFGVFIKTESILYGFISFIICSAIIIILTSKYEK